MRLFLQSQTISGILNQLNAEEIHKVVDRTGRLDIVLRPSFLLKRPRLRTWKTQLEQTYISVLESKLKSKLHLLTLGYLVTPSGTLSQKWHQDNPSPRKFTYLTVFVALTDSVKKNGTLQIMDKKSKISSYIEFFPGDILIFTGNITHRGTANRSKNTRYLFYLVYSVRKKDPNVSL